MTPPRDGLWRCIADHTVITIWDDRYCTSAATTNSTSKQRRVVELARREKLLEVRRVDFDAARTWADIAAVHDPPYVDAVRTGAPRGLATSQGFSWSPQLADAVARIWNGHAEACRLASRTGLVLHPVSGAHHACRDHGAAFCTFNFLVGAARALARDGISPIAIVDLDAHQGDGTIMLAAGDPGIATFDISGSEWVATGRHPHHEFHLARGADDYRAALERLPAFLDRVGPALVQYQAGMDPWELDPVGGIPGVTDELLRWRDAFVVGEVRRRGIPVAVNLAGGYVEGASEGLHVSTIRVMAGATGTRPAAVG